MANISFHSQANQTIHQPPHASNRRLFFRALAKLDEWRVPPHHALMFAARASNSSALNSHALALQAQLQQGKTLSQAFECEQAFWGERTVRLISQLGESQPGVAFRRLAAGAAEHPLQRLATSCFGMGWRRRLLCASAPIAMAALFLPILIHFKEAKKPLVVLPMPGFPYLASSNNYFEVLGPGWLRGRKPQWKRYWEVVDYNADTLHAAADLRPVTKNVALQLQSQGEVGDLARYVHRLNVEIGDPRLVACYLDTRRLLYPMAEQVELAVSLDQLVVSPVPAVWLQRAHRVSHVRDALEPRAGEARASMRHLQKSCPFLHRLIRIPSPTT